MIVGGVLVFLGLAFMVEWVWDKRKALPPLEYGVVLVILAAIIGRGVPARRRGRARARGRPVRGQLRADRAGARGRLRGDLPQQRRPPARRARGAADDGRPCPDPARATGSCSSDRPTACSSGSAQRVEADAAAVPGDRPPTRDRRGLLGGGGVRQGDAPGRGERVRAGVHRALRSGAEAAGARRGRRVRGDRPVRAGPGPRPAAVRGGAARGRRRRTPRRRGRVERWARRHAVRPADVPRAPGAPRGRPS